MIGKTTTDKMIDKTIIDKIIEETIIETFIDQIMEETIKENRDIEIEVKEGRILEIIIETIQEKDLSKVEIEIEIGVEKDMDDQDQEHYQEREESESRSRSNSRVSTNRDRIRCYRCKEYDHFAMECSNTTTDEEIDHSNSEQAALQMLMQENPINSEGQALVECLNL